MPDALFDQQPINALFRLSGTPVFPALSPNDEFHHHSLPAWDATGLPAIELGTAIESNKTLISAPAVLVSKLNPRKPRVAVVRPHDGERHCASTEFMCFFPRNQEEEIRYWGYYFGSTSFSMRLQRIAIGSTNSHTRASPREVLGWTVPNPPHSQKQAIANILDTLDTAIRQTEAIIEKLKLVKQGLLHDLLTRGIDANGELRPPQFQAPHLYKDSPLGWIPVDWRVELLDAIATRGSGHTPSKNVLSYWNGGVSWVSLADSHRLDQIYINSTDKEISELGIANSSAVKHAPGTVILSRDAGVGKSAVLASEMAVSQHFMAWRCTDVLNNLYLYFKLQHLKPVFESIAMGSTVKTIGLDYFKKLKIAVAERAEQDLAVDVLMGAEADTRAHESELVKLRLLKAGLMDDLLTGRVRVTPLLDANSAPA
jgi:type I restriction enzyme, S subunit